MITKIRTNIFLTRGELKKLRALSRKTGAPVAEVVRRAVDAYLERFDKGRKSKKPPKPGGWTEGGDLNEIIIG